MTASWRNLSFEQLGREAGPWCARALRRPEGGCDQDVGVGAGEGMEAVAGDGGAVMVVTAAVVVRRESGGARWEGTVGGHATQGGKAAVGVAGCLPAIFSRRRRRVCWGSRFG